MDDSGKTSAGWLRSRWVLLVLFMDNDTDLQYLLNRLRNRKFDNETCFLCARSLPRYGPTVEHVIPRWTQRRFELWDQELNLLNGTSIPYRQLTVPCCEECNKYRLQPIEEMMLGAVEEGAEAVRALGSRVLFLWLGKILYGLLYREVLLPFDRRNPAAGTIVPPTSLKFFLTHLMFLQEAREKLETIDFTPGSIFIFRTQQPKNIRFQWDFLDNVGHLTIGVRLGKVGIIGALADGGAQEMEPFIPPELFQLPLHPLQFRELFASITYRATTATRTSKFITIEGVPHKTYQLPLMGFSLKPLFYEWNVAEYAKYLSWYLELPYDEVFSPPDKVLTYIVDEEQNLRFMPLND